MIRTLRDLPPAHVLLGVLCAGLASANLVRLPWIGLAALAIVISSGVAVVDGGQRLVVLSLALAVAGWWWGSARLDAIDRSSLEPLIGTAERARVVVTAPVRRTQFAFRAMGEMRRFGDLRVDEPIVLELPLGRVPAEGDVLEALGVLAAPRGPDRGFDERTWLRRHGVHAVLRVDRWRRVGRRGGLGGVADRLRAWVEGGLADGAGGERRAVLLGIVLGEDEGLSDDLRNRFRASGLYHLLAVSGQNVALVAGGALFVAWLAGIPRIASEIGALAAILGYVLAVGAQPSVVRAGIAGALGSIAWLLARERDRWWFLLVGALALLAWSPYNLLDAGFQLSFAAVVSIFVLAPRLKRVLEGYPLPRLVASFLAVSAACGIATAPILWLQFGAVPLLAVPANALAAPAMPLLLAVALSAAAVHPIAPAVAVALTWIGGWCAAYVALCARVVGGLPFAQVRSSWAVALLAVSLAGFGWFSWRRRIMS